MVDTIVRDRATFARALVIAAGLGLPTDSLGAGVIVVGSGTPDSCTEVVLQNALAQAQGSGGALVRFACGADPVTIRLTQLSVYDSTVYLVAPHNTTIDGGGLVTLDGGFYPPASIFLIAQNSTVTLQNIGITGSWGYSAVRNEGKLDVKQAVFFDNSFSALENLGAVSVKNSLFANNGDILMAPGGAIVTAGTATVDGSTFVSNGGDGGAIFNSGTLFLKNSTFTDNHAEWFAGALTTYGLVDVDNCDFFTNRGFAGGAISHRGTFLTVKNSTFSENIGISPGAGGITSWGGDVIVTNTEFLGNFGTYAGGIYSAGGLAISNTLVDGNAAQHGGGITIAFGAGPTTIVNSTITNNTASVDGGGIYVEGDVFPRLIRTSVSGNTPNDIAPGS